MVGARCPTYWGWDPRFIPAVIPDLSSVTSYSLSSAHVIPRCLSFYVRPALAIQAYDYQPRPAGLACAGRIVLYAPSRPHVMTQRRHTAVTSDLQAWRHGRRDAECVYCDSLYRVPVPLNVYYELDPFTLRRLRVPSAGRRHLRQRRSQGKQPLQAPNAEK